MLDILSLGIAGIMSIDLTSYRYADAERYCDGEFYYYRLVDLPTNPFVVAAVVFLGYEFSAYFSSFNYSLTRLTLSSPRCSFAV